MSETTSPLGSPSDASARRPSAERLKDLIVTLLAPFFLWSCGGDPDFARLAAAEALDEFGITGYRSLIIAARIIAFELAALSSLGLSMADDMPPALALRLRGNANSLDRAVERNRRALEADQRAAKGPPMDMDAVAASVAETRELVRTATARMQAAPAQAAPVQPAPAQPAPARAVPPEPQPAQPQPAQPVRSLNNQPLRNAAWAEAMTDVAAEFIADMAKLPAVEQARERSRIAVLLEAATALATGTTVPFAAAPAAGRAGAVGGSLDPARPGQIRGQTPGQSPG